MNIHIVDYTLTEHCLIPVFLVENVMGKCCASGNIAAVKQHVYFSQRLEVLARAGSLSSSNDIDKRDLHSSQLQTLSPL